MIEGEVENLGEGYVYLTDNHNTGIIIDSAKIEGNRFRIVTDASYSFARVMTKKRPFATVILERGTLNISGDATTGDLTATGTPANDGHTAYMAGMEEFYTKLKAADTEEQRTEVFKWLHAYHLQIVEQNRDNVFGVEIYMNTNSLETPPAEMLAWLTALPDHLQQTPVARDAIERTRNKMASVPAEDGFNPFIDICLPDAEGNGIALSSVVNGGRNRYVLLEFWASWCGPCMAVVPTLKEAYAKYHDAGFEIYAVSFDYTAEKWLKTVADKGMTWINVWENDRSNSSAMKNYAVETIPDNVLIDCSNGAIIARRLKREELVAKFEELFSK